MKRSLSTVYRNTRSKRPRLVSGYNPPRRGRKMMVSATHLHNFMINDTLVDWLKCSRRRGTRRSPVYSSNLGFNHFIRKKGIDFETNIVSFIHNNTNIPVHHVSEFITKDSCQAAIQYMKEGAPILHSVPVRNDYNNTQGVIDLLVRSDYINKLVDETALSPEEEQMSAPKLDSPYHYVVIDVKFCTLQLRSDGIHLLNTGSYPAYKAQTLIYTQAIGMIQGYTAPHAFIMGRRWRYQTKDIIYSGNKCNDRLGKIDFKGIDKRYIDRTKKALKWVRDVRQHGSSWSISPPSREELYPNMCVDSKQWNSEKRKIAERIGEITTVWNVGPKHRHQALLQGIESWKDKDCTTKALGIKGARAPIIDSILSINRQNQEKIRPKRIKTDLYNWRAKGKEVFVDFETLSDIFSDFTTLPSSKHTGMIFMIGVGWEEDDKWYYRDFTCKSPTPQEEYRIMDEFIGFLKDMDCDRCVYWNAEKRFWTAAENRQFNRACAHDDESLKDHISDNWFPVEWVDLYTLFKTEPIVLKDCFKFGLKEVAKAMRQHKMIDAQIVSQCNSGMKAMIEAWKCYQESNKPEESPIMKDIVVYNEFDCKVLWEILSYLRRHH